MSIYPEVSIGIQYLIGFLIYKYVEHKRFNLFFSLLVGSVLGVLYHVITYVEGYLGLVTSAHKLDDWLRILFWIFLLCVIYTYPYLRRKNQV